MKRFVVCAALLFLLASVPAFATTVLKMDLSALEKSSEAIVIGKVQSIEAKFSDDAKTIHTWVVVAVSETLKGNPGSSVTVRQMGGSVGDKHLLVMGTPVFEVGDDVLLMIKKPDPESKFYFVSGLFQGRYLLFDRDGATYAVMDNGTGRKVFEQCAQDTVECLDKNAFRVTPLDELKASIKASIAKGVLK